jgi:signal recognition particle subunit SRP54
MFDTLSERLGSALEGVRGSGNLTEDQVKKVTREIRLALLEADVNYGVVKEFVGNVREQANVRLAPADGGDARGSQRPR